MFTGLGDVSRNITAQSGVRKLGLPSECGDSSIEAVMACEHQELFAREHRYPDRIESHRMGASGSRTLRTGPAELILISLIQTDESGSGAAALNRPSHVVQSRAQSGRTSSTCTIWTRCSPAPGKTTIPYRVMSLMSRETILLVLVHR